MSFPEEYGNAELAGKPSVFGVTVHEVSEPKEAEINEEFATSMGMESLEKLKDAIREQIGNDYESNVTWSYEEGFARPIDRTDTILNCRHQW